jgi:uncharacterized coiled-coil protein SlyX
MNETELIEMIRTLTNLVNQQSVQIAAIQNDLRLLTETVNNFVITREEETEAIPPPDFFAERLAPMFETIRGLVPGGVSERPMTVEELRQQGREIYGTPVLRVPSPPDEVRRSSRQVVQVHEIGAVGNHQLVNGPRMDPFSGAPVEPGGRQSPFSPEEIRMLQESPFALRQPAREVSMGPRSETWHVPGTNPASEIVLTPAPAKAAVRKPHPLDL